MRKEISILLQRFFIFLLFSYLVLLTQTFALPFNILPKAGTQLPTTVNFSVTSSVPAFYTVYNNTVAPRFNNYVKYLPPNVRQVTTGGVYGDTCGLTFNLAGKDQPGSSCTLQLAVFGPVNPTNPSPKNHLFVCFPKGITCAGSLYELNVTAINLVSLSVLPASENLFIGNTLQYSAIGNYSNGSSSVLTSTVTWASSNHSVASITTSGLATAVGAGLSTITASLQNVTSNPATLNVKAVTLSSIAIVPMTASANSGETVQYTATGTYTDGTTQDLTATVMWQSSNVSVATIDSTGLATAVSVGSTTVTAELQGVLSNTASLTVNNGLVSIAVTPTNASINTGGTQQFTATGTYADHTTADISTAVTWLSSNTSVGTINTTGLATGVAAGSSTITASQSGITSTGAMLNVSNPLVSIAVTPTPGFVTPRSSLQFTATGTFNDGSMQNITQTVTWNSSNTANATITTGGANAGLAKGVAIGSSNVTASLSGKTSNSVPLQVQSFLYVVNYATNISYCNLNGSGSITGCLTSTAAVSPQEITINPIGTFAYVTESSPASGIFVCTLNATDGSLSGCIQTVVLTSPGQIAITPANTFAYIANETGITKCNINSTTGALSSCSLTGDVTFTNPVGIAVNPAGTFAYITDATANNVTYCAINTNGALSGCTVTGTGFSDPLEIAIDPSGGFAYITNSTSTTISSCPINVNGTFGTCATSAVMFSSPRGIAQNTSGSFAYVTNFSSNAVSTCTVTAGFFTSCTPSASTYSSPFGIAVN